jgi:hypothetical protein
MDIIDVTKKLYFSTCIKPALMRFSSENFNHYLALFFIDFFNSTIESVKGPSITLIVSPILKGIERVSVFTANSSTLPTFY